MRPSLDVAVGYLEHGPPHVTDVADVAVVVPLLLASGYHARIDLPAQAPTAHITPALGPDERLTDALVARLREVDYDGASSVVLAAAGSSDDRALAEVRQAARSLAGRLGVEVTAAFVSAGSPRIAEVQPRVVASYLLAPGAFQDDVERCGADLVSAPIGDHPSVAEVVLARYDAALSG